MSEDLDALSSRELHDRAMHRARRHLDVRFAWRLLKALPAAQAAAGDLDEANADITHVSALVTDALTAESDADALEGLRPIYIDYLRQHTD